MIARSDSAYTYAYRSSPPSAVTSTLPLSRASTGAVADLRASIANASASLQLQLTSVRARNMDAITARIDALRAEISSLEQALERASGPDLLLAGPIPFEDIEQMDCERQGIRNKISHCRQAILELSSRLAKASII